MIKDRCFQYNEKSENAIRLENGLIEANNHNVNIEVIIKSLQNDPSFAYNKKNRKIRIPSTRDSQRERLEIWCDYCSRDQGRQPTPEEYAIADAIDEKTYRFRNENDKMYEDCSWCDSVYYLENKSPKSLERQRKIEFYRAQAEKYRSLSEEKGYEKLKKIG